MFKKNLLPQSFIYKRQCNTVYYMIIYLITLIGFIGHNNNLYIDDFKI